MNAFKEFSFLQNFHKLISQIEKKVDLIDITMEVIYLLPLK